MRVYLAVGIAELDRLAAGDVLDLERFVPASGEEEDELAALEQAAETGPAAAAAEIDGADDPIALEHIAAFHVDLDGSGHLAWYATQELPAVRALLT